ncbi:hypothetical protein H7X69_01220 [Candidatus Saccharibacteria bacterium]|nr:hypothetical protein [Candidatus Saccharibacteria bacterium]
MSETPNFENEPSALPSRETEPLIEDHEVFIMSLQFQMELNNQTFSSYQEARNAANFYTAKLDRIVFESEIGGKMATITGESLVIPSLIHDANLGSVDLSTNLIKRSDNDPLTEPSVSGSFFGFTPYGMPLNEEGTIFRATIGHQVAVITNLNLPSFCGALMAYGPISLSSCEFLDDRKSKDATAAIETLTSIDDESTAIVIQRIDELLNSDDRFHQKNLRKMARLIRRHLSDDNRNFDDRHKDALLDLVKARLGLYSNEPFMLEALSSIETTVYQSNYIVGGSGEGRVTIKDVTYAPYYWKDGDVLTVKPNQPALSIIVERTDKDNNLKLISIPFEKIRILKPVSDIILETE